MGTTMATPATVVVPSTQMANSACGVAPGVTVGYRCRMTRARRHPVAILPSERNALGLWPLTMTMRDYPGWSVQAEIDDSGPTGEIVRMTIERADYKDGTRRSFADDDPRARGGVSARMLQAISTVEIMFHANELLEYVTPARLSDPRKRKRTRLTAADEEWWANLAQDYVRLSRTSRRARSELADKYGMKSNQMRDVLERARRDGWLTRGGQGRTRGELGPRTIEFMEKRKR